MANQITLEEALELVEFELLPEGWRVKSVNGSVYGDVQGNVYGDVWCDVWGTINGRKWQFVQTPKEKLKRLIDEGADYTQLLEALNQLEDSNG
jgi:hypothetical protein